jgi:hypothetical protein
VLLDEKIVALQRAFEAAGIPHAFGGAQALAYYAAPRATHDIDLNVFAKADRAPEVLRLLAELGAATDAPGLVERIERDGQARVFWDRTPIDLFFSYDPLHESSMRRRRSVPFGADRIHVLSAEDLMVYKVIFDRAKDWRDLAELVYAANDPLDVDYVREWLGRILAPDDPRHARLERLVESGGSDLGGNA